MPKATKVRKARARRPKTVSVTLLLAEEHPQVYQRLHDLVAQHHGELLQANIAVAWNTAWRLDIDGHLTLGAVKRASDLDRELAAFDFVVLLNREWWEHPSTTAIQRDALMDHELSHCTVREDPNTREPMRDERGRIVYRLRRHDLEEFTSIAARYGIWKRDLEAFAEALARSPHPRLPLDEEHDDAVERHQARGGPRLVN